MTNARIAELPRRTPLLELRDLRKRFTGRAGTVSALDGVSLRIAPGETFGLVGESGSGKSTLARAVMQLVPLDGGEMRFDGRRVALAGPATHAHAWRWPRARPLHDADAATPLDRTQVQMVFQDPLAALNPRQTVGRAIEEPLIVHRRGSASERAGRVRELAASVGLHADWLLRHPHELSGGQRQRVGIARALALSPRLLVLDEAVSALDVSVRAQILNLLLRLQRERGLAYLFISHDLAVVRHMAHHVGVMQHGRLVECGSAGQVWHAPAHPYTQSLLQAVPHAPGADQAVTVVQ